MRMYKILKFYFLNSDKIIILEVFMIFFSVLIFFNKLQFCNFNFYENDFLWKQMVYNFFPHFSDVLLNHFWTNIYLQWSNFYYSLDDYN